MAVILPVYNGGERIRLVVDEVIAFASGRPDCYFLFVDDGSTDNSYSTIKNTLSAIDNVGISGYRDNRGKGYAVRFGFEYIEAEHYCFTDSDLAYPLGLLDVINVELEGCDVVIGSRRLLNSRRRPNLLRHILGESYNHLMRMTLGLPFRDTQAGLKGFRREVVKQVFPKITIEGFGFDAEALFIAAKMGYTIKEIAVKEAETHSYKTCKIRLSKDSARMFRDLLRVRRNDLMGRYG